MRPGDEPHGNPAPSAHTTGADRGAADDAVVEGGKADTAEVTPAWLEALMAEVIGVEETPPPADDTPGKRASETADATPAPDRPSLGVVVPPQGSEPTGRTAGSITPDPSVLIDTILQEEFGVYVQAASAPPPVPAFGEPAPAWEPPAESPSEPARESPPESVAPPPVPALDEPQPMREPPGEPPPDTVGESASVPSLTPTLDDPKPVSELPVGPLRQPASQPPAPVPAAGEPTPAADPPRESVASLPAGAVDEPKSAWKPPVDPLRDYESKPAGGAAEEPAPASEPRIGSAPAPVTEPVSDAVVPPPPVPASEEPVPAWEPPIEPTRENVAPLPEEPAPAEAAPRLADPRLDDEWD
ncbi:MAG: hypothetical protein ACLPTB_06395 [Acidimicrobiales bacterium]